MKKLGRFALFAVFTLVLVLSACLLVACDDGNNWEENACNHVVVVDEMVAPTCTTTGLTEGTHCSKCGKILQAQNEIPALGHTGGTATCIEQATCERCNEKYGELAKHEYKDGVCIVCGSRRPSEGLEYSLNSDGNGYTVTGIGTCTDKELIISSEYNAKPVTRIGLEAFRVCTGLKSVIIPNSVTSIGDSAFYGCTGLKSVTIPDSVTSIGRSAFYGCTGLKSATIPNSVTSIGDYAFYGCTGLMTGNWNATACTSAGSYNNPIFIGCSNLATVNIGDNVKIIPSYAFYGCTGLKSVTIGSSVTSIGNLDFSSCYNLQDIYITDIAAWCNISGLDNLMRYCASNKKLYINNELATSITIPDGVTSIGESAFEGYTGLTNVTIPNSVTSIGNYAFYNCTGLMSITIPDSVTSIGSKAFSGCTWLTNITIPDSVTSIGDYAFRECNNLQDVYITEIGAWCNISGLDNLMRYCASNKKLYINNELATSITIPNGVTAIPSYAFSGCTWLTSVTIGKGVTSIDKGAFLECRNLQDIYITEIGAWCNISGLDNLMEYGSSKKNLYINNELVTSIIIPDGVTAIPSYAFYKCSSLTSVTIPNSVTSIGNYAFYNCTGLTSITIPDSVTSIGRSAFSGCTELKSVTIGKRVTSIGDYAFYNCTGLTTVNWNATACTSAGSYNNPIFIDCSNLATVNIGDNVKIIPSYAFEGCRGLTSITIPNSVTRIGESAFRSCTGLTNVTIPNSVTSIGEKVFYNCRGLTNINFEGTKAQWNAISKGYEWNYNVPSSCKIVCTDGTI